MCKYAQVSRGVRFRIGDLSFTWDAAKQEANVRKHGIPFEEAATTWMDGFAIERFDEEHAGDEDRWLRIGMSLRGALLVVWSTERETASRLIIRIIEARRTSTRERKLYETKKEDRRR